MKIGGAQRLIADLLPILNEQEDCTLLVFQDVDNIFTRQLMSKGVEILSLNMPLHSPLSIFRLRRAIKGYDIVHVHLFPLLYWAAIASIGLKCKLLYTEHSTSNKRRGKWYLKPIECMIYKRYKKILAISEQTKTALIAWLGKTFSQRIIVCKNGVDLTPFRERNNRQTHTDFKLMMVSRFVPAKDQDTVIRALTRLPDRVTVTFVGDGERLDSCKQLTKSLNLMDRVSFLGARSDIPQLLSQADVGIQSSHWEGFGLTAVEIMAAGKPVIASEVDGLKQVVEGAGLLFKQGNDYDLAAKIIRLFSDRQLYEEVAERCSLRSKQFDICKTADEYLSVYYSV